MRVALIAAALVLTEPIGFGVPAARADEPQLSEYLARVQGVALYISVNGKPPCDFVRERLLTSAKFALNSASIPFDSDPETVEDEGRSRWAAIVIEARALDAGSICAWTLQTKLIAPIEGGEIFGLPSARSPVQLWTARGLGSAYGNNLTSNVEKSQDAHLKTLINDMFESRKRYPS